MTNRTFSLIILILVTLSVVEGIVLFSCKNEALMLEKDIFFLKRNYQKTKERIKLLHLEEIVLLNPIQLRDIAKQTNWQVDNPINAISYEDFIRKHG